MAIKKNDQVIVIAGNAKNKTGRVKEVIGDRVIVSGLNMRKKHVKPSQENPQGGRIEEEGSIHISNVMAYSEESQKGSRMKVLEVDDGKKVRVLKACGTEFGERY